ncbi:MAG TPA: metallophosphoesterase family protein [Treponemataceae bacterium]|jgi:uncharacterized protein|nr:metallophosphoesterase family protein [Spirochaetaceae bacterium]HOE08543.1 metallophosphoesterase family protein [Treponemataceae bacterium]
MRFLVLSDIHGDLAYVETLNEEFVKADAVLFAGDFARVSEEQTGKPVLDRLTKKHDVLFSVLGNCDPQSFLDELDSYDVSVQGNLAFMDGLAFIGAGGGTKFTGLTPNERSEDDIASDLSLVTDSGETDWNNLVMIIHNPPHNTGLDKISAGLHVGSPKIRQIIETIQPLAVITGHIHESYGIEMIGKTLVINPGSLAEGRYGVLEIEKKDGLFTAKAELFDIKI